MEVFKEGIYMISKNNLYKSTNMKDLVKLKSAHIYVGIEANDDKLVVYKDRGVYEVKYAKQMIYVNF